MNKTAVITGLRGQDGSYLAEQLLDEGYKVYGMIRRASHGLDLGCLAHLEGSKDLEVVEGDLLDGSGLIRLCKQARPDLFFQLAAQSHVGSSFGQPIYTMQVNSIGTLNCLEAIRLSGIHTRFLHAATSELFGGMSDKPANEEALFHPRSPYGVSKLAAFWITVNYREAYKIFACNSIAFNHECLFTDTPVFLKYPSGEINIDYVCNLVPNRANVSNDNNYLTKDYCEDNIKIWDGENWVLLRAVSRRKLSTLQLEDQRKTISNTRNGSIITTPNHNLYTATNDKVQPKQCKLGTHLLHGEYPLIEPSKIITREYACLLGMLASDGYISEDGKQIRLINNDADIKRQFQRLVSASFCNSSYKFTDGVSGFGGRSSYVDVNGLGGINGSVLRDLLYDKKTKHKKVPMLVLNAGSNIQEAFLEGYYKGDGLKKDKCVYRFKSFKTSSPLLAQGVLYLIHRFSNQTFNINTFLQNNRIYHQVNLHSDINPNNFGKHLKKNPIELKKMFNIDNLDPQHVYDIETSSGKFMAGIGNLIIANSPRRGPNFVTRKITKAVANIVAGKQDKLYLGNLEARRDWGFAEDFTRGMILMLTRSPTPQDYVLATGITHSVRDFCDAAFKYVGLDYLDFVEVDPAFYRPAEVDVLIGDYSKINKELGWKPTVTFERLVQLMVDHDLQELGETKEC